MAEKDITEKILMSYADVFADCINTLVYHGERRLNPEDTQPAPTESFYKSRPTHNQFCDASRYLTENGTIVLQYIIENETRLEERQILRTISYQGGSYRQQLESGIPVYGVIAIVIAWTGKTSRIPRSLHALLLRNGASPERIEQIDDNKLTVYHTNSLPLEIRSRFTSDLGFVADYLNEGSFERRKGQEIIHLEALCDMMEAVTGDARFTEQVRELMEKKKGKKIMMCEYINQMEAKGEAKMTALLERLYDLGRREDAEQAVRDLETRARLYREFSNCQCEGICFGNMHGSGKFISV